MSRLGSEKIGRTKAFCFDRGPLTSVEATHGREQRDPSNEEATRDVIRRTRHNDGMQRSLDHADGDGERKGCAETATAKRGVQVTGLC